MARTYSRRPSDLFNIKDEYTAWCFDEAVYRWGRHVEDQLDKIEGKNKAQIEERSKRLLKRLLGQGSGFETPKQLPVSPEEAGLDA